VAQEKGIAAEGMDLRNPFLDGQNKICPAVATAEGYHLTQQITGSLRPGCFLMADDLHRSFFCEKASPV
jgi:hypothetical protein